MFLYDGCSKRFDYNVLNLTRNSNISNLKIQKKPQIRGSIWAIKHLNYIKKVYLVLSGAADFSVCGASIFGLFLLAGLFCC